MNRPTLVAIVLLLTSLAARAQDADEFTRRITGELALLNQEAVPVFERANAARDAEQWLAAESLYDEVLELAPSFDHARRRKAWCVLSLGRQDEAIALVDDVYTARPAVENRSAAIHVRLQPGAAGVIAPEHYTRALTLARTQMREERLEANDLFIVCSAAMTGQDAKLLGRAVERASKVAPEEYTTHYFAWVLAIFERDPIAASDALEKSRELGLPEDTYQQLLARTANPEAWLSGSESTDEKGETWLDALLFYGAWVVGIWAGIVLLLFIAGSILSSMALTASLRVPTVRGGESVGATAFLRSAYGLVLWISCIFYYLSIPLVLCSVVLLGGAVIYGFFALGRIPIYFVLMIVAGTLVTIWAALRSLFISFRDEDPGTRLDLSTQPRLREVLDEVAGEIGTRPVDNVYLTPGTDLAVFERGGVRRQLAHSSERCLILGVGVLEGMKLGPFKAILGHEYGHFVNRDTAGGGFALAVRQSLSTMALLLAHGGAAQPYNPAWIFLNGFYRLFVRVSHGASRLQEVLADRWSAYAYGARSFEEGLRHVIARSIRFDADSQTALSEIVAQKKPLANLYDYRPAHPVPDEKIDAVYEAAINAQPSQYDSHPAPADRFAWVHALGTEGKGDLSDAEQDVWTLFSDRVLLETQMTEIVRESVRLQHGIEIPVPA